MRWLTYTERGLYVVGFLLLMLSAVLATRTWMSTLGLERAQATVTENEARMNAAGNVSYFPHLRFRLRGGQLREVASVRGFGEDDYTPGERVAVLYAPAQPQRIVIANFTRLYRTPLEAAAFAAALLDAAVVLRGRRRRGPSKSRRTLLR